MKRRLRRDLADSRFQHALTTSELIKAYNDLAAVRYDLVNAYNKQAQIHRDREELIKENSRLRIALIRDPRIPVERVDPSFELSSFTVRGEIGDYVDMIAKPPTDDYLLRLMRNEAPKESE